MEKKILLSVFVVFLVLALVGCVIVPDVSQKEEIKEVINNYWSALSNRQYSLAKSYCIPNGNFYNNVDLVIIYQDIPYYDLSKATWIPYINWVCIIDNKAVANIDITVNYAICFEGIYTDVSGMMKDYSIDLIKIAGDWKLK